MSRAILLVVIELERGTPNTTLNGGSLGSWVDEERSKLRVNL